MYWSIVLSMASGLGLFLFGIQTFSSGIQKAAGDRLRQVFEVLTSYPLLALLTGFIVTALLQSSSATTVIVVGFANAGLMTLQQTVGIILGCNIGTTITAQILALNIGYIALPLISVGSAVNYFGKRKLYRYIGQSILGLGLLFLGLTTMSAAMYPLRDSPYFLDLLVRFGKYPILGFLVGALFTGLVQSSSVATGVIIALAIQGVITLHAAFAIIVGSNVGTCITALIASVGTTLPARRTAYAHLLFNLLGAVIFLILLKPFTALIEISSPSIVRQVANAHLFFNLISVLIVLPFFRYFIRFVEILTPGEDKVTVDLRPKYLDERVLKTPSIAIGEARHEIIRMAHLSMGMVREAMNVLLAGEKQNIPNIREIETLVNIQERAIVTYMTKLLRHSLSTEQAKEVSRLTCAVKDMERVGDHAQNILEMAESKHENKLTFSMQATTELKNFYQLVETVLQDAINSFISDDVSLARSVINNDDKVDDLERELRKNHIERFSRDECCPHAGIIFIEVLSNLERVADHAVNIAEVVTGDFP